MDFVIDSGNRLSSTEHTLTSENTSSDFVIKLPNQITKFYITEYEIPLSYYVIDENYNTIIFRALSPPAPNVYYIARIVTGTYSDTTIAGAVQTALTNSVPLINELLPPLGAFVVAYTGLTRKLTITAPQKIQFITTSSTSLPGIPFADPDGFPSELLVGAPISPIRATLNNTAKIIGLPINAVIPDPTTTIYGFPIGQQYGFDVAFPLPNMVNLTGENYIYLKTDLIGETLIKQAKKNNLSVNESDLTIISSNSTDRGIIARFQVNQSQYSKLIGNITPLNSVVEQPNYIKFDVPTDIINFRLSFQNNYPVNLNGVDMSFVIKGQ